METFSALFELASVSLACRDQDTLLKTFAARVGASAKGAEGLVCRTRWNEAGERFAPQGESVSDGLLAEVYESAETRRVSSKEIAADDFEHLDEPSRSRVKSAIVVSLPGAQRAEGVVEVLNKRALSGRSQPPGRLRAYEPGSDRRRAPGAALHPGTPHRAL
jgi:hypothetical protein